MALSLRWGGEPRKSSSGTSFALADAGRYSLLCDRLHVLRGRYHVGSRQNAERMLESSCCEGRLDGWQAFNRTMSRPKLAKGFHFMVVLFRSPFIQLRDLVRQCCRCLASSLQPTPDLLLVRPPPMGQRSHRLANLRCTARSATPIL